MKNRRALIFGVGGQDGAYLARYLVERGYEVHGTSRDVAATHFAGLRKLHILDDVHLHSADLTDYESLLATLQAINPSEIYNLSAQSSVGLSFEQPIETIDSIMVATLNLLEALRHLNADVRLYNASSSEMFGNVSGEWADENTNFRPRSPYGIAKASAHWLVQSYREGYGLYACSGILFNHESPLRGERFVTQKIVRGAVDIKLGRRKNLKLGDLSIVRDWGWAPEYVAAMWSMLQQPGPEDFVIATGKGTSLKEFTRIVFAHLDLDWQDFVIHNSSLARPYEVGATVGNAELAERKLGWSAKLKMPEVATLLVDLELERRHFEL